MSMTVSVNSLASTSMMIEDEHWTRESENRVQWLLIAAAALWEDYKANKDNKDNNGRLLITDAGRRDIRRESLPGDE